MFGILLIATTVQGFGHFTGTDVERRVYEVQFEDDCDDDLSAGDLPFFTEQTDASDPRECTHISTEKLAIVYELEGTFEPMSWLRLNISTYGFSEADEPFNYCDAIEEGLVFPAAFNAEALLNSNDVLSSAGFQPLVPDAAAFSNGAREFMLPNVPYDRIRDTFNASVNYFVIPDGSDEFDPVFDGSREIFPDSPTLRWRKLDRRFNRVLC